MKKLITLFTLILSIASVAQNLVPNPSFEFYSEPLAPYMNNGDLNTCTPWFRTPTYPGGGGGTSDYVNTNMPLNIQSGDVYEFQEPHSGFGVADFIACSYNPISMSSESIEIRLSEPMEIGETYEVNFYVKKSQGLFQGVSCICGSDELGIYFHTDTVYSATSITDHEDITKIDNFLRLYGPDTTDLGNPTSVFLQYLQMPNVALDTLINDEENWYLVSDTVYANKSYEFMTFARFNVFEDIQWTVDTTCGNSSYYSRMVLDDVSVYLVNETHLLADAGQDTTICLGESVQIGASEHEDYMYWWTPNEDMETSIYGNVNPGMPWVSPTETTTYSLTQKDFAFLETTDQITITVEECIGINEYENGFVKVYPNPVQDFIEIESGYAISSWKILNAIGKEVASSKCLVSSRHLVPDVSSFDTGLYFLEMEVNGIQVIKQLVIE